MEARDCLYKWVVPSHVLEHCTFTCHMNVLNQTHLVHVISSLVKTATSEKDKGGMRNVECCGAPGTWLGATKLIDHSFKNTHSFWNENKEMMWTLHTTSHSSTDKQCSAGVMEKLMLFFTEIMCLFTLVFNISSVHQVFTDTPTSHSSYSET